MQKLSDFVTNGRLTHASTSGATQNVDFSDGDIHLSEADTLITTYTFSGAKTVDSKKLIIDHPGLTPWSLTEAVYDDIKWTPTSGPEVGDLWLLRFNPDGTKLYFMGWDDILYQYSVATPYDLSTITYDNVSFSCQAQETSPDGWTFGKDGTKLYVTGSSSDSTHQYSVSTPYDLSAVTYDNKAFNPTQNAYSSCVIFNPDGTRMYLLRDGVRYLDQYYLTTAWEIDTAAHNDILYLWELPSDAYTPDVRISPDGAHMFAIQDRGIVHHWTMNTPWDTNGGEKYVGSFNVSELFPKSEWNYYGLEIHPNGDKLYIYVPWSNDSTVFNPGLFQFSIMAPGSLVFPAETELPYEIPIKAFSKSALEVVTTDGGASYQVTNWQTWIK
ncbi:MAG: hypothetical protein R6V30_08855 [Paracoccaceae bacterium]